MNILAVALALTNTVACLSNDVEIVEPEVNVITNGPVLNAQLKDVFNYDVVVTNVDLSSYIDESKLDGYATKEYVDDEVKKVIIDEKDPVFISWKNGTTIDAGQGASATGNRAISIGQSTTATGADDVHIGAGITQLDGSLQSVIIGSRSKGGSNSVILGVGANGRWNDIAIGSEADATHDGAIVVGHKATSHGANTATLLSEDSAKNSDNRLDALYIGDTKVGDIVYTKTETDNKITPINTSISSINQELADINQEIAAKADSDDVYTKSETDSKIAAATPADYDSVKAKADGAVQKTEFDEVTSRQDANIATIANIAEGAVQKTEFNNSIDSISLRIDSVQSDVDDITTQVADIEISLADKANKSSVYTKTQTDTMFSSAWNQINENDSAVQNIDNSLKNHINNHNNPHQVTVNQIGAMPANGSYKNAGFAEVSGTAFSGREDGFRIFEYAPHGNQYAGVLLTNTVDGITSKWNNDGSDVLTKNLGDSYYQPKIDANTDLSIKTVTARSGVKSSGFMTTTPADKFAFAGVGTNISQLEPDGSQVLTQNKADGIYQKILTSSTAITVGGVDATKVVAGEIESTKIDGTSVSVSGKPVLTKEEATSTYQAKPTDGSEFITKSTADTIYQPIITNSDSLMVDKLSAQNAIITRGYIDTVNANKISIDNNATTSSSSCDFIFTTVNSTPSLVIDNVTQILKNGIIPLVGEDELAAFEQQTREAINKKLSDDVVINNLSVTNLTISDTMSFYGIPGVSAGISSSSQKFDISYHTTTSSLIPDDSPFMTRNTSDARYVQSANIVNNISSATDKDQPASANSVISYVQEYTSDLTDDFASLTNPKFKESIYLPQTGSLIWQNNNNSLLTLYYDSQISSAVMTKKLNVIDNNLTSSLIPDGSPFATAKSVSNVVKNASSKLAVSDGQPSLIEHGKFYCFKPLSTSGTPISISPDFDTNENEARLYLDYRTAASQLQISDSTVTVLYKDGSTKLTAFAAPNRYEVDLKWFQTTEKNAAESGKIVIVNAYKIAE